MSDINFISINENFPVPGQDNDTQVFRDNFDTIKRSFRTASDEITDLQDNTAKTNEDNDFNKQELKNLVLNNISIRLKNYGSPLTNNQQAIEFPQGLHHVLRVGTNINLNLAGFPGDTLVPTAELLSGVGKITVELYGDGSPRIVTFNQPNGTVVKACDVPSPLVVQSTTDPILLEIYRYNANTIFIKYIGQFV